MTERQEGESAGSAGQGDALPQDGLGRDAAHGPDHPAFTGGSHGRATGAGGGVDLLGIDASAGDATGRHAPARPSGSVDATAPQRTAGAEGSRDASNVNGVDLDADVGGSRRDPANS